MRHIYRIVLSAGVGGGLAGFVGPLLGLASITIGAIAAVTTILLFVALSKIS